MIHLYECDKLDWEIHSGTNYGSVKIRHLYDDMCAPADLDYDELSPYGYFSRSPIRVDIQLIATYAGKKHEVLKMNLSLTDGLNSSREIFCILNHDNCPQTSNLAYELIHSKEMDEVKEIGQEGVYLYCPLVGIINSLTLDPEFENQAIELWLYDNLAKMIRIAFNADLGCLITEVDSELAEEKSDEDFEPYGIYSDAYEAMRSNGWRAIEDKVYIRNFIDDALSLPE